MSSRDGSSPTAFIEGEGGLGPAPAMPGNAGFGRAFWLSGYLGFVAGLPLAMTGPALLQWLADGGGALAVVGLTATVGLPYTLKFLWAPVLDRMAPLPFLRRLGQRRGWLLPIQALLVAACAGFAALGDPVGAPSVLLGLATLIAFASANQDIVIDAWRIETFPERVQGNALAFYIWGYRLALLVAGPGAIWLSVDWGWRIALLALTALVATGMVATLLAREPARSAVRPGHWFGQAVVAPLRDLLGRPSAVRILLFVALFKLGEALAHRVAYSFYKDLGFLPRQVAAATGVPGLLASLVGAALGGALVLRIGAGRALIITGLVQMASMALYFALAVSHGEPAVLWAKIIRGERGGGDGRRGVPDLPGGALLAAFTATQYALLSSVAVRGTARWAGIRRAGRGDGVGAVLCDDDLRGGTGHADHAEPGAAAARTPACGVERRHFRPPGALGCACHTATTLRSGSSLAAPPASVESWPAWCWRGAGAPSSPRGTGRGWRTWRMARGSGHCRWHWTWRTRRRWPSA